MSSLADDIRRHVSGVARWRASMAFLARNLSSTNAVHCRAIFCVDEAHFSVPINQEQNIFGALSSPKARIHYSCASCKGGPLLKNFDPFLTNRDSTAFRVRLFSL